MNELHWAVEWLLAALLVLGGVFTLIGAIGLLRFPDFYMRLHAPTKATTLGVGGVLLASVVLGWAQGELGLPALLITGFLFITAPVSAMPASLVRIARSADSISSQILGFVFICAIVGLNLLADRRRRSRARSSAS